MRQARSVKGVIMPSVFMCFLFLYIITMLFPIVAFLHNVNGGERDVWRVDSERRDCLRLSRSVWVKAFEMRFNIARAKIQLECESLWKINTQTSLAWVIITSDLSKFKCFIFLEIIDAFSHIKIFLHRKKFCREFISSIISYSIKVPSELLSSASRSNENELNNGRRRSTCK